MQSPQTISRTSFSTLRELLLHSFMEKLSFRSEYWALVLSTVFFNCGISIFLFLYSLFLVDLGRKEKALGFLTSAMVLGGLCGSLPMGMLARRFGLKLVLSTALSITALVLTSVIFFTWYPAQILLAFVWGAAMCSWNVCVSPALAAAVPEKQRPLAFSILFAVAVASCGFGGVAGGILPNWMQHQWSQQGNSQLTALQAKQFALLLGAICVALAALPAMHLGSTKGGQRMHLLRPSPFLKKFLLSSALWSASIGAFAPFTSLFFTRHLAVSLQHLGSLFSVVQLVQGVAVLFLSRWFIDHFGLFEGILVTQLFAGISLCLLAFGHSFLQAGIFYCAFMVAQHLSDPAIQTLLMNRMSPEDRSDAMAMNYLSISMAQAIAAAVTGLALARFNYPPVLVAIASCIVFAALLFRALCKEASTPAS